MLQSQDRVGPQDIVGVRSSSVIAPNPAFYSFPIRPIPSSPQSEDRPRDLAVDDAPLSVPTLALRVLRIYDILTVELPDHLATIQALPQGQLPPNQRRKHSSAEYPGGRQGGPRILGGYPPVHLLPGSVVGPL